MQTNGQVRNLLNNCLFFFLRYMQVTIQTDDMELAGTVVQSIGKFLNLTDLQTTADFPQELDELQQVFRQVKLNIIRN